MKRFLLYIFLFLLPLSFMWFCGKKGPILPPLVKVPQKIETISVIQRGGRFIINWKNPVGYIDGSPLEGIQEVEIWQLEESKEEGKTLTPVTGEAFNSDSQLLLLIPAEKMSAYLTGEDPESPGFEYIFSFKIGDIAAKRFTFGLKVTDNRGKYSEFSKFISLEPKVVPEPPQELTAVVHKDKITVIWKAEEKNIDQSTPTVAKGYNIYRFSGEDRPQKMNALLLTGTSFEDIGFSFGSRYRYSVRASASEAPPFLESENSTEFEVLAEDTFPPAAPQGLSAIAGEENISLSWNPNQEQDLAGYKVWRKKRQEMKYQLLTPEILGDNSYSDADVEENVLYDYTVTAFDISDNQSAEAELVSIIIQGGKHENISL